MAIIVTWIINKKYLYKVAKRLNITDVYGEEELYTTFIRSDDVKWIWVRYIPLGLTYEGYVKNFSEDEQMQEIELGDVKVYSTEDATLQYEVSGIYLAAPRGEFVIEIPKITEI
jgi:hypothetical protein